MSGQMTLKDGLVKQLTADIVSGKYKVGDSLPSERELSAMFGVSRTVVRVGLAELAASGLVETKDRSGSVVLDFQNNASMPVLNAILSSGGNLSAELMQGFLEARMLLEVETARLAARRRSDEDLFQLYGILRRELTFGSDSAQEMTETSFLFHRQIAVAGGNPIYPIFICSMESTYKILLRQYYDGGVTAGEVVPMHRRLYEAIFDKDENAAAAGMKEILEYRV